MRPRREDLFFIVASCLLSALFFLYMPPGVRGSQEDTTARMLNLALTASAATFQWILAILTGCVWFFLRRSRAMFYFSLSSFFGGAVVALSELIFHTDGKVPDIFYSTCASLLVFSVAMLFNHTCDEYLGSRDARFSRAIWRTLKALFVVLALSATANQVVYYTGEVSHTLDILNRSLCGIAVLLTIARVVATSLVVRNRAFRPIALAAIVYGASGISDLIVTTPDVFIASHRVTAGGILMGLFLFVAMAMEYATARKKMLSWNAELESAVTERTRELEESNEKLTRLEMHRRKMIANIAHDLRTPITAIHGAIQLLEGASEGADDDSPIRIASLRSRQLAGRVKDLFDLTQLETGAAPLRKSRTTAIELISTIYAHYETESHYWPDGGAPPAAVRLSAGERDAGIDIDFERIWQVFDNLVENARRHAATQVELDFSMHLDDEFAVFSLRDNGPGISPEDIERVFDRLFTKPSPGNDTKGTGLGLAIARSIVEAHGGQIWVENAAPCGCRFSFTIPMHRK